MDKKKKGSNFAPQKGKQCSCILFLKHDSVAQLVEQMTLNHWVVGSSPTGVTRQSIKMQKTSEIQTISEVFRYPQPAFLRRILKWRGVPKGYIASRSGDCTLARVLTAIIQMFTPSSRFYNHGVVASSEGTFFHRTPDCTLECTLGYSY